MSNACVSVDMSNACVSVDMFVVWTHQHSYPWILLCSCLRISMHGQSNHDFSSSCTSESIDNLLSSQLNVLRIQSCLLFAVSYLFTIWSCFVVAAPWSDSPMMLLSSQCSISWQSNHALSSQLNVLQVMNEGPADKDYIIRSNFPKVIAEVRKYGPARDWTKEDVDVILRLWDKLAAMVGLN